MSSLPVLQAAEARLLCAVWLADPRRAHRGAGSMGCQPLMRKTRPLGTRVFPECGPTRVAAVGWACPVAAAPRLPGLHPSRAGSFAP